MKQDTLACMIAGWFQQMLDVSAVDLDTSAGETGSVASGDDANESVSSSIISPLGHTGDRLGDGLLCEDSDSSDVEDAYEDNKGGWFELLFLSFFLFFKDKFLVCFFKFCILCSCNCCNIGGHVCL